MMLYKWRHHQRGAERWDPEITFTRKNQSTTPRDYLTREERSKIRDEREAVSELLTVHGEQ